MPKHHQVQTPRVAARVRRDGDFYRHKAATALHARTGHADSQVGGGGFTEGRTQARAQAFAHQQQQVLHRGATGPHQKIVGGAAKVQGFVAAVDQHRGRGKAVQNQLLRNAGHLAQGRGAAGGGQLKACPVVAQARGQGQRVGPGAALALKNAPFFGNRVEQVVPHAVGLGTAQQQVAVFAQGKVKNIEHPLLQVGLQVDQHIAATDQVHPTKRRVRKQVL